MTFRPLQPTPTTTPQGGGFRALSPAPLGQIQPPQEPEKKGIFGRLMDIPSKLKSEVETQSQNRAGKFKEVTEASKQGQDFGSTFLQRTGNAVGAAIIDPVVSIAKTGASLLTEGQKERGTKIAKDVASPFLFGIDKASEAISDIPAVQKFSLKPESETLDRNFEAVMNLTAILPVGEAKPLVKASGLGKASEVIHEGVWKFSDEVSDASKTIFTKSEEQLEKSIVSKFEKGVKPLIPGKTTPTQVTKYKSSVVDAVNTINENKGALKFIQDSGEVVAGKTPSSLQQFSESIEQTKKIIFKQYDDLAKQAGGSGNVIDLQGVADDLDTIIGSKSLAISNPQTITYAQQAKENLLKFGSLDTSTTQDVVQQFNQKLKAFYRNPTPEGAGNVTIDAMIANSLRQQADEFITGLTGTEYGSLKAKYGSLKAVERDVVKANLRDARKNTKGLIDFTDIFTGADVVTGMLTMNPATLARGGIMRVLKEYYKYINDPNNIIKKMFQDVEKLGEKIKPKKPATKGLGDLGLSIKDVSGEANQSFLGKPKSSLQNTPQSKTPIPAKKVIPNTTTKTSTKSSLLEEAKKFDSADEFIKKVDDERITFKTKDGKSSVTVTESTPEYELVDDITQSQLEKLGLDSDDFITKIEHIEVDKSLQGKGLGTKLMNRAIKETIENGHDFVYLNASPMGNKGLSLDGLTKFYEEFGFKIIKKQGNNNLMGATKSQLKDIYNKAQGTKTTSLQQEAKTFKSADEFIEAQTNAYHGSYTEVKKFEDGYFGETTANNEAEVFYFTKSEHHAVEYSREAFARKFEGEYYDKFPKLTGKDAKGNYGTALMKKLYDDASANIQTNPSFVDIKNPAIKDWEGQTLAKRWEEAYEFINEAKLDGHDGVIFKNISDDVNKASVPPQDVVIAFKPDQIKTKSQLKDIYNKAKGVTVKSEEIVKKSPQQLSQEIKTELKSTSDVVRDVSLEKTIPQQEKLHKSLTENGRVLVNDKGEQVFPKPIKENPTPLENPIIQEAKAGLKEEKELKKVQDALDGVSKKHGQTEVIIESLKKKGVSQGEIDNIVLENGDKLVDTVKVKRETNGVLSATIRKDTLKEMKEGFTLDIADKKWIPTKTAMQKIKEGVKGGKETALTYYELPQIFFDRTGLRKQFYDPIREAERNAQNMKTAIFNDFEKAGLLKRGGWFTAERFDISKKEAENIGKYYLTRQKRGGGIELSDLSPKETKFVKTFDKVIKESEERFFKVSELNGKSPGKVENYAPIMTNADYKLAQEVGDMDFIFRKHPAFFSLKKRVEKVPLDMYELDYRKVASRWIDQMANFNHLGEVGVQTKYLANSNEFKDIVGDKVFNTTNKWLQNKFNPQILSPAEKGGRFLRQKTAIASLGLNLSSVLKQTLTQVPLTIIEKAPPKLRSKFARDFGINVSDIASLKERKGNVSIMDMQQGLNKAFVGPLSEFDKTNAQLSLNRLLDKNYNKVLKEGKEVSPEIQAQIIKQAQDTLDIWYGGMTTSQLPQAFRTELGKLINMFIYPLTSQLNGFIYSVAKAKGFNRAEKFAEVMASALVIAYMEQVITNLSPEWSDSKEMAEDTLASLAGNIPILSQAVFAFRTDQPITPSPIISSVSRAWQQTSKGFDDQATMGDVAFAWAELFGLPKAIRRATQGVELVEEGGLRDRNGKLLAPVKGTWEQLRGFLRGKYGTIATQDWIRNIGVKAESREWYVPEVEFLQNGDYERKAELYNLFDKETKDELYNELSEGQQKKLDKALSEKPTSKMFAPKGVSTGMFAPK